MIENRPDPNFAGSGAGIHIEAYIPYILRFKCTNQAARL